MESTKSTFAEILSLLRREKGLSQRRAATDLGISQALLSHYENGAREPKLEFVVKACDYYVVTADYILGRTEERGDQALMLMAELKGIAEEIKNVRSSGGALIEKLKRLGVDN